MKFVIKTLQLKEFYGRIFLPPLAISCLVFLFTKEVSTTLVAVLFTFLGSTFINIFTSWFLPLKKRIYEIQELGIKVFNEENEIVKTINWNEIKYYQLDSTNSFLTLKIKTLVDSETIYVHDQSGSTKDLMEFYKTIEPKLKINGRDVFASKGYKIIASLLLISPFVIGVLIYFLRIEFTKFILASMLVYSSLTLPFCINILSRDKDP